MQRSVSALLTALLATAAIAPNTLAYADLDEIRRETLEPLAQVDFDKLRQENRDKVDFNKLREENRDKVDFDKLREENRDKANSLSVA